jgi:hypothetical protein
MFNPLNLIRSVIAWFSEGISFKAKVLLALVALFFFVGMGLVGYKINDYFENDPNACMTCHVHDDANHAWQVSEHKAINCHECHHSSKKEQVVQMYRFVFMGVKSVAPRHGEVIVAWKICYSCHWEKNEKFSSAKNVSRSRLHARHVFMEQIECVKCHGYNIHKFTAEPRFCTKCHEDKEVHGIGMEGLACLNCHTDRTVDLKPGRNKCLFCHGSEKVRQEMLAGGTLDVTHYQPDEKTIKRAIKIKVPADAPMQFHCYECHKPHQTARPTWGNCLNCHKNTPNVGKHSLHLGMDMKCKDCHIPHIWRVTPEQAKKDCVKCHGYKDPKSFIGS